MKRKGDGLDYHDPKKRKEDSGGPISIPKIGEATLSALSGSSTFTEGQKIFQSGVVAGVLQLGPLLRATVQSHTAQVTLDPSSSSIKTVECTCGASSWCPHVVASLLFCSAFPAKVVDYTATSEWAKGLDSQQLHNVLMNLLWKVPGAGPAVGDMIDESSFWGHSAAFTSENAKETLRAVTESGSTTTTTYPPLAEILTPFVEKMKSCLSTPSWGGMAFVCDEMLGQVKQLCVAKRFSDASTFLQTLGNLVFNVKNNGINVNTLSSLRHFGTAVHFLFLSWVFHTDGIQPLSSDKDKDLPETQSASAAIKRGTPMGPSDVEAINESLQTLKDCVDGWSGLLSANGVTRWSFGSAICAFETKWSNAFLSKAMNSDELLPYDTVPEDWKDKAEVLETLGMTTESLRLYRHVRDRQSVIRLLSHMDKPCEAFEYFADCPSSDVAHDFVSTFCRKEPFLAAKAVFVMLAKNFEVPQKVIEVRPLILPMLSWLCSLISAPNPSACELPDIPTQTSAKHLSEVLPPLSPQPETESPKMDVVGQEKDKKQFSVRSLGDISADVCAKALLEESPEVFRLVFSSVDPNLRKRLFAECVAQVFMSARAMRHSEILSRFERELEKCGMWNAAFLLLLKNGVTESNVSHVMDIAMHLGHEAISKAVSAVKSAYFSLSTRSSLSVFYPSLSPSHRFHLVSCVLSLVLKQNVNTNYCEEDEKRHVKEVVELCEMCFQDACSLQSSLSQLCAQIIDNLSQPLAGRQIVELFVSQGMHEYALQVAARTVLILERVSDRRSYQGRPQDEFAKMCTWFLEVFVPFFLDSSGSRKYSGICVISYELLIDRLCKHSDKSRFETLANRALELGSPSLSLRLLMAASVNTDSFLPKAFQLATKHDLVESYTTYLLKFNLKPIIFHKQSKQLAAIGFPLCALRLLGRCLSDSSAHALAPEVGELPIDTVLRLGLNLSVVKHFCEPSFLSSIYFLSDVMRFYDEILLKNQNESVETLKFQVLHTLVDCPGTSTDPKFTLAERERATKELITVAYKLGDDFIDKARKCAEIDSCVFIPLSAADALFHLDRKEEAMDMSLKHLETWDHCRGQAVDFGFELASELGKLDEFTKLCIENILKASQNPGVRITTNESYLRAPIEILSDFIALAGRCEIQEKAQPSDEMKKVEQERTLKVLEASLPFFAKECKNREKEIEYVCSLIPAFGPETLYPLVESLSNTLTISQNSICLAKQCAEIQHDLYPPLVSTILKRALGQSGLATPAPAPRDLRWVLSYALQKLPEGDFDLCVDALKKRIASFEENEAVVDFCIECGKIKTAEDLYLAIPYFHFPSQPTLTLVVEIITGHLANFQKHMGENETDTTPLREFLETLKAECMLFDDSARVAVVVKLLRENGLLDLSFEFGKRMFENRTTQLLHFQELFEVALEKDKLEQHQIEQKKLEIEAKEMETEGEVAKEQEQENLVPKPTNLCLELVRAITQLNEVLARCSPIKLACWLWEDHGQTEAAKLLINKICRQLDLVGWFSLADISWMCDWLIKEDQGSMAWTVVKKCFEDCTSVDSFKLAMRIGTATKGSEAEAQQDLKKILAQKGNWIRKDETLTEIEMICRNWEGASECASQITSNSQFLQVALRVVQNLSQIPAEKSRLCCEKFLFRAQTLIFRPWHRDFETSGIDGQVLALLTACKSFHEDVPKMLAAHEGLQTIRSLSQNLSASESSYRLLISHMKSTHAFLKQTKCGMYPGDLMDRIRQSYESMRSAHSRKRKLLSLMEDALDNDGMPRR